MGLYFNINKDFIIPQDILFQKTKSPLQNCYYKQYVIVRVKNSVADAQNVSADTTRAITEIYEKGKHYYRIFYEN